MQGQHAKTNIIIINFGLAFFHTFVFNVFTQKKYPSGKIQIHILKMKFLSTDLPFFDAFVFGT